MLVKKLMRQLLLFFIETEIDDHTCRQSSTHRSMALLPLKLYYEFSHIWEYIFDIRVQMFCIEHISAFVSTVQLFLGQYKGALSSLIRHRNHTVIWWILISYQDDCLREHTDKQRKGHEHRLFLYRRWMTKMVIIREMNVKYFGWWRYSFFFLSTVDDF